MTMKLKWVNHIGIAFELDFDNNFTEEEAYDRAEEQLEKSSRPRAAYSKRPS